MAAFLQAPHSDKIFDLVVIYKIIIFAIYNT